MTDQAPTTPGTVVVPGFAPYRRSQIAELRPYVDGEKLSDRVSVSAADREAGSPKPGDMIARNPVNHDDQWLVAADYFAANFEAARPAATPGGEREAIALEEVEETIVHNLRIRGMRSADTPAVQDVFDALDEWKGIADREFNNRTAARAEATKNRHLLGEILAVIHRDGGHKVEEVGLESAVSEAIAILAALSRPAPVEGEAVAWRVRPRGDSKWNLWDENPADLSPDRFEVEPLYATPQPAAARGGEDALLEHFRAMQRMATAYLVPEDYRDRNGRMTFQGDNNNTEFWKAAQAGHRAIAFANDMIHMLDGPEQRAALSAKGGS